MDNPTEENANYTAGKDPITDKDVIDNLGIAVFNEDKLVGELSGLESLCHILVNNELKSCVLAVPNPKKNNTFIDLNLTSERKTKSSVTYIDAFPTITIDIYLIAQGLSLDDTINYDSQEDLSLIENSASQYITEQITNYLYKTSKQYNSDICGFGKYALKNYLTLDEWYSSNWLNNYKNSSFNVNIHLKLKSGNLFDKS